MSRLRRNRRGLSAEMNVVPYIDVMLVLLVIFMITAPLLNQAVEIELPQSDQAADVTLPEELPEDLLPLVLSIDGVGRFYLNWRVDGTTDDAAVIALNEHELQSIAASVLQVYPQLPVLLQADRSVDYGRVMEGISLLKAAGAPHVGLSTSLPEDKTQP